MKACPCRQEAAASGNAQVRRAHASVPISFVPAVTASRPSSNFDYGGPLSEMVLLGCLAEARRPGQTRRVGRREGRGHEPARIEPPRAAGIPQGLGTGLAQGNQIAPGSDFNIDEAFGLMVLDLVKAMRMEKAFVPLGTGAGCGSCSIEADDAAFAWPSRYEDRGKENRV